MTMLEERLREGLAAEAQAWPDPSAPGASRRSSATRGLGVALIAAAAVFVVIGGVAVADRLGTSDATPLGVGGAGDEPTATVAPASTAVPVPDVEQLPRFTLDLPGWSVINVVDFDNGTAGYFGQRSDAVGAVITVWADNPGDAPGTGYEHALTALSDGDPLGSVDAVAGVSAVAFRHGDDNSADYTFLWQHTDSMSVEVIVYVDSFDEARGVVTAIAPIAEETWIDLTDGYREERSATPSTTLAPVAELSEATVEHPVTLSDGTDVVISLLVAAGTDRPVLWSADLSRGPYDESYEAAPSSALVHVWFYRSADDVIRGLEETERLSGSVLLTHNRYIVDHDGHAYDFQFDDSTGPDVPQEILDTWVSAITVSQSPDSILPIVTISDEYELGYGPTHSFEGTYVDGEPVVVAITEGCEVEPGAPVEHSNEDRASISSCELDGRVELLISGSPDYIERTRSHEFVRITTNP